MNILSSIIKLLLKISIWVMYLVFWGAIIAVGVGIWMDSDIGVFTKILGTLAEVFVIFTVVGFMHGVSPFKLMGILFRR